MEVARNLFQVQHPEFLICTLRIQCQRTDGRRQHYKVIYQMMQDHMIQRIPLGAAGKIQSHQEARDLH